MITALIAVGFAAMVAFVALYATGSRGWYRTPVGRNLMALPAVLLGLLGLWLLSRAFGPLPLWMWVGGLGSLDAVMVWRVAILWRLQHRRRD